jgi:hypothetical protein
MGGMGVLSFAVRSADLRRLYDDWQSSRRGRKFPARADFDPLDFKYILGSLSLIDVIGAPPRFRIRLHASNIVDRAGMDLTGKFIDEMPAERRDKALAHYSRVLQERAPIAIAYEGEPIDERLWNCEILVLPLSSDGANVDMLISAFDWDDGA